MSKISVIVPVYDVENYLEKCVESIQNQSVSDIEIILIDDGSKDRSGEICDMLMLQDHRIKVIHQSNQGVSAARNAGIDAAAGKYLAFIDADDYIEPQMLKKLYTIAEKYSADVVACGAFLYDHQSRKYLPGLTAKGAYNHRQLMESVFLLPNPLGGCIWNKLFRRDVLGDVRYPVGVSMAEDRIFLYEFYLKAKRGYKIPNPYYHVVERPDSATRSRDFNGSCTMLKSSRYMMLLAKKQGKKMECIATIKYLSDCNLYIHEMIVNNSSGYIGFVRKKTIVGFLIDMFITNVYTRIFAGMSKQTFHAYLRDWWVLVKEYGRFFGFNTISLLLIGIIKK